MPCSPDNTDDEKDAARKVVSDHTADIDEEYEVLCALGLL